VRPGVGMLLDFRARAGGLIAVLALWL